ncbi:PREDICTED: uncharacterized protein LOC108561757 [Nicrophorus vespilloides]|uniref:Uncharacterized protein LOC108561757 n=1 Tax=Nicrophorus vespilloides TaxID=110193 RepID=A0ABM1ML48_NICVS|nr:PREDICTED: uncharacterized protein LOC108561757 [Nicrophorus vespilloides]
MNEKLEGHEEEKKKFKNTILLQLLFLPFNPIWEVMLQFTLVWLIMQCVYKYHYNPSYSIYMDNLVYYTLELMYLVDSLLALLHRYSKDINKFGLHQSRNVFLLLLDFISLLPIYELVYLVFPEYAESIRHAVRLKCVARIIHFFFFIHSKRNITSTNPLFLVFMVHLILVQMFALLASVLWSSLGCVDDCKTPSWAEKVYRYGIRPHLKTEWFALCYSTMSNVVMHNWSGFLVHRNVYESLILMIFMMIGYSMHAIVIIGHMTKVLLQKISRQYDYKRLLNQFNTILSDQPHLRNRIQSFCKVLWTQHGGIIYRPSSVHLLPMSLKKEIYLDIFWDAFNHSHLLKHLDICVKKEISLVMSNEFYLSGDYIMKVNTQKRKLIYIVSGIVQVLSMEDDESPILSFSSGTVLSEITTVLLLPSNANLRCATNCVIQTLKLTDMFKVFRNYTSATPKIREEVMQRIAKARRSISLRQLVPNESWDRPIFRLKKQWRVVAELDEMKKKKLHLNPLSIKCRVPNFNSEYLDLLTLTDKLELQTTPICLNSKCPYVMDQNSSFRMFLFYIHFATVVLQSILIPYMISFGTSNDTFFAGSLVLDNIYMFDLYVQASTAVETPSTKITKFSEIILYRFKSIMFLIDVLATVPYDYVAALFGVPRESQLLYKLPRILKSYKIVEFIIYKQRTLRYNRIAIIVVKYFTIYLLIGYFVMCTMIGFFCFGDCKYRSLKTSSDKSNADTYYFASAYTISALMNISLSRRTATSVFEMCFYSLTTLVGMYLYSLFLSELNCNIIKMNEENFMFRDKLRMIYNFMVNNVMPTSFRQNALDYLYFNWFNEKHIDINDYHESIPLELKWELVTKKLINGLKFVPIFSKYSDEVLTMLATCAVLRTLPADTIICSANVRPLYIHIIMRGMSCEMPGDLDRKVKRILQFGDSFPVIETFHNVNSLNTVVAISAVEEICLDFNAAMCVLKSCRLEYSNLEITLKWHMNKYQSLLNRQYGHLIGDDGKKRKPKEIGDLFEFEIFDEEVVGTNDQRSRLGILRFVIMKNSINPHGNFFITWECFRSLLAVVYFVVYSLVDTMMKEYWQYTIYAFTGIKIVFAIDIYIRCHVQYYNRNNIVVTDLMSTVMHYLKTSFLADVVTLFPFYEWGLYRIYIGGVYNLLRITTAMNLLFNSIYFAMILYRPFMGLTYMDWNIKGYRHYVGHAFKLMLFFVAIAIIFSNNILLTICVKYGFNYMCTGDSNIIANSILPDSQLNKNLLLLCLHAVSARFGSTYVAYGRDEMTGGALETFFIAIFFWICRLFVIASITGAAMGSNMQIIKYRNSMTNFISFINKEMVDESTIKVFIDHFEYVWKKCEGVVMSKLLDTFDEKLHLDMREYLFLATIQKSKLFTNVDRTSLRVFIKYFEIQYFMLDADIIRCNDIQANLYFVSKGEVDVYIAGCKMVTLKRGGCFGSLTKMDATRQTIRVVAKYHVELLTIPSHQFYVLAKDFPLILLRLNNAISCGDEYIDCMEINTHLYQMNIVGKDDMALIDKKLYTIYMKINDFVKPESKYYKLYEYAVHVHVAPISCIVLLLLQFLDLHYIYLQFHLHYTDVESGVRVTEPSKIRKRYTNTLIFWVDLLGLVPLELLMYAINGPMIICMNSRLIRFLHLVLYYHGSKRTLGLNIVLQCSYICYMVMFELTVMSLIWYRISCTEKECSFVTVHGYKKHTASPSA